MQLEKKGWIAARERSGYYVQYPQQRRLQLPAISAPGSAPSTVQVNEKVQRIRDGRRYKNVIPLDAAAPPNELFPLNKLHKALLHSVRAHRSLCVNYSDLNGYEPLRKLIARSTLSWKQTINPADIIITNGCMEAISLCLRAVAKPGDTIAIESPTFFGLLMTIESLGMKALEIPTDPVSGISLEKLEQAFRKKQVKACLVISNYNNPLGSCMPAAAKKALAQLLHKYQVPLIEDDAFGELHHGPDRPATIKAFDRDGWVLHCSSFSKWLAPGYRLGWVMPGRYFARVEQLKFMTTFSTGLLPQLAVHSYLEQQRPDLHLKQLRQALAIQTQQMAQAIQQYFPADTQLTCPEGAFNMWVVCNKKTDTWELHRQAEAHRISIMPGTLFTSRQQYKHCMRISAALPWNDDLAKAVQTVGKLIRRINN
jgi:DNA-binding transcriptional MocR family regulator